MYVIIYVYDVEKLVVIRRLCKIMELNISFTLFRIAVHPSKIQVMYTFHKVEHVCLMCTVVLNETRAIRAAAERSVHCNGAKEWNE